MVELLLEYGATVDTRSGMGRTSLHCAASGECQEVGRVELLLDHGANVSAQTEDRWTALHWAAEWGNLQPRGGLTGAWRESSFPVR